MPEITCVPGFDLAAIERHLAELDQRRRQAIRRAAADGAAQLQQDAQATTAYTGVTGATRAGTVAYVADAAGAGKFDAAYQAAAEKLAEARSPRGHVYRTPVPGPATPQDTAIILTVPTDYIDRLEFGTAGEKAFLGPTLAQDALAITAAIAAATREVLR
jgi:uncharacterized protein YciW